jgi:TonB family protein
MKLVPLTKTACLALVLAAAACGNAEGPQDEAPGAAPAAAQAGAPDYGYEMMSDPASAPAQPAAATDPGAGIQEGRLAPEIIQATVRGRFPVMRACYEAALQQAPALAGRVEVQFHIHPDGTVTDAQSTAQSTIADQAMVQCVVATIAGTSFPASDGGVVDVVYPIMFSPGDD